MNTVKTKELHRVQPTPHRRRFEQIKETIWVVIVLVVQLTTQPLQAREIEMVVPNV